MSKMLKKLNLFFKKNQKSLFAGLIFLGILIFALIYIIPSVWILVNVFDEFRNNLNKNQDIEITKKIDQNILPILKNKQVSLFINTDSCKILGIWDSSLTSTFTLYQEKTNCSENYTNKDFLPEFKIQDFDTDTNALFDDLKNESSFVLNKDKQIKITNIQKANIFKDNILEDANGYILKDFPIKFVLESKYLNSDKKSQSEFYLYKEDVVPENQTSIKYENIQETWYKKYNLR